MKERDGKSETRETVCPESLEALKSIESPSKDVIIRWEWQRDRQNKHVIQHRNSTNPLNMVYLNTCKYWCVCVCVRVCVCVCVCVCFYHSHVFLSIIVWLLAAIRLNLSHVRPVSPSVRSR